MRRQNITKTQQYALRRMFLAGRTGSHLAAKELNISNTTTWRYFREFARIKASYPDRLDDMDFYMPEEAVPHRQTTLFSQFEAVLPALYANEAPDVKAMTIWNKYIVLYPDGYSYSVFKTNFRKWVAARVVIPPARKVKHISEADLKVLKKCRRSNNHRYWQLAVTLMSARDGVPIKEIMTKTEAARRTVTDWINNYNKKGLKGLYKKPREGSKLVARRIQERKDNIVRLLHETPALHGLNRTSWTITALTEVYNRIHQPNITYRQLSRCLHQLGYKYKKTRDLLTSPDPNFREKIKHIQETLRKLKPDEKFFSIDEYGPVSIKMKGGRTIKQQAESSDWVPSKQKCKGIVICTAALELSTNQVTHFYSERKNSFEMIKLIDVLVKQYYDQKRIYLCWDAVSWHNSTFVKDHVKYHNANNTPEIRFAPLPASTQFLNVIESVFAGLAKAVIHNSDYQTVDDCKAAIDLHFASRNAHFKANPKKAGKKIWGKELVRAKFSDTNHCRKEHAMRGAR